MCYYNPFIFHGIAEKINIISNNISYRPCPEQDEEIEQRLTINANGRVWFSGYHFRSGFENYVRGRRKNFTIGKEAAARILNSIAIYFSQEHKIEIATDIGSWDLIITNAEGKPYKYTGSSCCDFEVDGVDLSDLIRDTLGMPDLFVFNGNFKPDRVDKITINYHKLTNQKSHALLNDLAEDCKWDYSEKLVLDRETLTMEYLQDMGSEGIISRKYSGGDGVVGLLDDLDADSIFDSIAENDPGLIENALETKLYEIIVDFKKRPQLLIKGFFDKNGLPDDFPEFAEELLNFMQRFGTGEILDPAFYNKTNRKRDDYIFCSVEFNEKGKSYYYLTEDDTLKIGDKVVVAVGDESHLAIAKITKIDYFPEDQVPFPINRTKPILRKCTKDELHPPQPIFVNFNEDL